MLNRDISGIQKTTENRLSEASFIFYLIMTDQHCIIEKIYK